MNTIEQFIESLSRYPEYLGIVNPYSGTSYASIVRRDNLQLYFTHLKEDNPYYMLLGEAPGYRGCCLTGIPFTSEKVIKTHPYFRVKGYRLIHDSSRYETEISATIVWNEIGNYPKKPLIWNILPFHPHSTGNPRTNRTPSDLELRAGKEFLLMLLDLFKIKKVIALGRKAESQIFDIGIEFRYLRHPANGGKDKFIAGLRTEMMSE